MTLPNCLHLIFENHQWILYKIRLLLSWQPSCSQSVFSCNWGKSPSTPDLASSSAFWDRTTLPSPTLCAGSWVSILAFLSSHAPSFSLPVCVHLLVGFAAHSSVRVHHSIRFTGQEQWGDSSPPVCKTLVILFMRHIVEKHLNFLAWFYWILWHSFSRSYVQRNSFILRTK